MIVALAADPVAVDALLASDHWRRDGDWFPWFPLVPLFFVALWVFLVAVVLRRRGRAFPGQSAEGVLAERYARGEIDETEYHERRSVLRRKD
jgi:putative membrane protein